jgi:site-specific recombinase XerC
MKSTSTLAGLLESFFGRRLVEQRNASPTTVESYRDALRLLVRYVAKRTKREPCALAITDFDHDTILDFLEQLERVRGNLAQTRNARLTAIRSFFRHVAASDPGSLGIAQRVLAIPSKRTTSAPPQSLAEDELAAILNASKSLTVQGRRDFTLLLFLARTGRGSRRPSRSMLPICGWSGPNRSCSVARGASTDACHSRPISRRHFARSAASGGWEPTSAVPSSSASAANG